MYSYYWNFSNRTDWNISDKWKMFARYSDFRTHQTQDNYGNSPALGWENQGIMNSRNIAVDSVYTLNPTTVLNLRGSYAALIDDFGPDGAPVPESLFGQFWPGNPWYKPYLKDLPALYYPNLNVSGTNFGKGQIYWQHPFNYSHHASLSKNHGRHYLKFGAEGRHRRGDAFRPNLMNFLFGPELTADTYITPNTRLRGSQWATFLLGALGSDSQAQYIPIQTPEFDTWAGYFQDDLKLNRTVTFNLGLRYEYETAPRDPANRLSRYLDLTSPLPEMQSNPPLIPADILALRTAPPAFNGAWVFTDANHRRMWNGSRTGVMPRAGVALRLNDKTALRAGFARYIVPPMLTVDTLGSLQYPGYNARTTGAPVIEGVPGGRLFDPFPASNPLILPVGNGNGRYTNLGDSAAWNIQDLRTGVNDRINVSLQRRLPYLIHGEITYFANLGHNLPYTKQMNLADPQLSYTYKALLDQRVPNPFYQYLTPNKFPGQLRNQATVTRGSLLAPYPQYGALAQSNTDGILNRYQALQVKAQRDFVNGFFFLAAYNYNRERSYAFFNSVDEYAGRFAFQDSDNPRHRMTISGTYELPFGKGRRLLSRAPAVINAILGGWSTSHLFMYNSGQFIRFGPLVASGNPRLDNPTRDRWFDTSKFQQLPAFTPRLNPWQYDGLTGPRYWGLDSTLAKTFLLNERFKLEFKLEAYNTTNSFIPSMPNVTVTSSLFGRSTNQANVGRQMQYTVRLIF